MTKKKRIRDRRKKRRGEPSGSKLKDKVEKSPPAEGRSMTWLTTHGEKMSEVILDFAEPLLEQAEDEEAIRKVIAVAVVAWNLSVLVEENPEQSFDDLLAETYAKSPELLGDEELMEVFRLLHDRKREHFSNNKRHVLDFEVVRKGKKLHLNVVSVIVPPTR